MGRRPQVEGLSSGPTVELDEDGGVVARPRGLRTGMAVAEVVALLGPADMVTRGPAGREIRTWNGVSAALLDAGAAGPGLLAGAGIGWTSRSDDDALTVVVRFDELQRVTSLTLLACRG